MRLKSILNKNSLCWKQSGDMVQTLSANEILLLNEYEGALGCIICNLDDLTVPSVTFQLCI